MDKIKKQRSYSKLKMDGRKIRPKKTPGTTTEEVIKFLNAMEVGTSARLDDKNHAYRMRHLIRRHKQRFGKKRFQIGLGRDNKHHIWRLS